MKRADNSTDVSLFPFMAVLLCTMGVLMVLLLVMARQARRHAARTPIPGAEADPQPDRPDLNKQEIDKLEQQIDNLENDRQVTEKAVLDRRRRLQHLEQHMRTLGEQLLEAEQAAQRLRETQKNQGLDRDQLEKEAARLRRLVKEAQELFEQELADARRRRPSFAVVPYLGPNKTQRRPIYVECLKDEVILQPEGVKLRMEDFESPLGPKNPLASAIRAASEYFILRNEGAANSGAAPEGARNGDAEPYPLLLVRPEGIMTYYRARRALESWNSDFGYELIGQEWKLEFPPSRPELAVTERRAVEQARAIRLHMARIAPSRYQPGGVGAGGAYQALPSGGFVPAGRNLADYESQGSDYGTGSFAQQRIEVNNQRLGGETSDEPDMNDPTNRDPSENQQTASRGPSLLGSQRNASGESLEAVVEPEKKVAQALKGNAAEKTPGFRSSSGTSAQQDAQVVGGPGGPGTSPNSHTMAQSRGHDWALPDAKAGLIPIRRSLHVVCRADRLAILPNGSASVTAVQATAASSASHVVTLPGSTEQGIDEFVSKVWDQIRSWGIAGSGMYWRPIIVLHVAPDGRHRADELSLLLKDSGLDLTESAPREAKRLYFRPPSLRKVSR